MAPPRQVSKPTVPSSSKAGGAQLRRIARPPPAPKLNTALSAHPRTDPLNALSVLLKLLTSLPARIGGCQYKLTQAEHALALHLVGVLDPYVYHGMRALAHPMGGDTSAAFVGLVHQPTEILDAILFHVDARRDLLNVGLACKRLHDVVFPRHFDYRVIRAKVSSIAVWNHLILHRSLARNVRRVEIIDERTSSTTAIVAPRGMLQRDTDLESTDDELTMHAKQERFLATALVRMTGLQEFKWSCNHSPISIANVWPTLMMRAVNLKSINICDNLVFSPRTEEDEDDEDDGGETSESDSDADGGVGGGKQMLAKVPATALLDMESVTFRSTPHVYGSSKNPELGRIAAMLHQCVNLKALEIIYITPRTAAAATALPGGISARTRPLSDEFLTYGRWAHLTSLTLSNLRCGSYAIVAAFLKAHPALEVLNVDLSVHGAGTANGGGLVLEPGSMPRLREVRASKEVINAIFACPLSSNADDVSESALRPLEAIKGFKLSGHAANTATSSARSIPDTTFLANLRMHAGTIKRVEMTGWHDMEDVKRLAACVPRVQYLDVGRRLGGNGGHGVNRNTSDKDISLKEKAPVANIIEWTEFLATLPELVTLHGVKFFYEVASAPSSSLPAPHSNTISSSPSSNPILATHTHATTNPILQSIAHLSMMERSRLRKNDETAGVLAWKCPKLRRVDHWDTAESGSGRVIVLLREHAGDDGGREGKVRWEVRRVR
ncbi:hypothetical protein BDN70DRAFT_870223 [Pholiota conissans]|uniref:F-box domain-containing protein n=1 Tax=Pholiota conissans TaxID=109636 RepID=A0A9P5ZFJ6_9AGAR|nr:hypothetical protein BDN70DRAFT_870223 [Pholiota conissans]